MTIFSCIVSVIKISFPPCKEPFSHFFSLINTHEYIMDAKTANMSPSCPQDDSRIACIITLGKIIVHELIIWRSCEYVSTDDKWERQTMKNNKIVH